MKNAMQLKGLVKNISREKKISAQLVLQNYMLERLLERISKSEYQQNFILKGGFLIAAIVGLDTRATMDMDVTIKGELLTEENIQKMFDAIITVSLDDDIIFTFKSISEIREGDDYQGYRVALTANFPPMAVPLKLDITTGDKITPKEIEFSYQPLFDGEIIPVLAYNLETVLAEKLEAIISRGDQTTRPRDYYDVYILQKLQESNVNFEHLKKALQTTAEKRGSWEIIKDYQAILTVCQNSEVMHKQWNTYQKTFNYATEISFKETCNAIEALLDKLFNA